VLPRVDAIVSRTARSHARALDLPHDVYRTGEQSGPRAR